MTFGDLKSGDVLYLIDYNPFKKDLTYIKGLVQSSIVNEPQKDNNLNNVYQQLLQKNINTQLPVNITITALFNGVPFPFTVTKDMTIARADNRVICITKEDVLQEIKVRKTDASNQIKLLDSYNKILDECKRVEEELLGDENIPSETNDSRLNLLEKKIEELTKIIINGQNKEINLGNEQKQIIQTPQTQSA